MKLGTARNTTSGVPLVTPFLPFNSGVQAIIRHQLDGVPISNRLWFRYDVPPFTATEMEGVADGVAAWWTEEVLPFLSADLLTTVVDVLDWTADPPPQQVITLVNTFGGDARESSSANVAVVVPFRWPINVRLLRNRHFVPGVPEEEISLNTPSTAIRDALWSAYTNLVDRARLFSPVLTWRWVAGSSWSNGVLRDELFQRSVQGTDNTRQFKLGQRRRRLPLGYAP